MDPRSDHLLLCEIRWKNDRRGCLPGPRKRPGTQRRRFISIGFSSLLRSTDQPVPLSLLYSQSIWLAYLTVQPQAWRGSSRTGRAKITVLSGNDCIRPSNAAAETYQVRIGLRSIMLTDAPSRWIPVREIFSALVSASNAPREVSASR